MLSSKLTAITTFFRFTPPDAHTLPARRVDLDWLRIALFGLLIVHHIGMFYVTNWGWHAKSQYRAEWLESLLLIVEPWRMPAIWLISGIAIRFILAKVDVWRFVSMRSLRLLLPLLFGILIVVPPQLYIEMTAKGEINMGYWQFMQAFVQSDHPIFSDYQYGIWPHVDVNHLWYLRSLWQYSLLMVVLLPLLNSSLMQRLTERLVSVHGAIALLFLALPVYVIELVLQETGTRYAIGLLMLLYGYLLGWQPQAWKKIKQSLKPLAVAYAVIILMLIVGYNLFWLDMIKGSELPPAIILSMILVYSLARVIGLILVLALAQRFFNARGKWLAYFSDAVYPFYILHQTLILVIGYQLSLWQLGPVTEVTLVALGTIAACFGLFEVIRRTDVLRPFFGLKMKHTYSLMLTRSGYVTSAVVIAPLAWQLLM